MSDSAGESPADPVRALLAEPRTTGLESRRGPITLGLVLTTMMIAIDTTVVNVALPHMQGSLSASPEQVTWILTSFIVAQAVLTPISGWLAARVGMKRALLGCALAFTLSSILCGMATTLPEMVLFRTLQGVSGAPMAPLSLAVLLNIYPPERMGRAMALFSMATVLAPIIGPVLGAWLTEDFSWRWCFYINLPVGIASLVLLWIFMPNDRVERQRFDFLGYGALAIAIAGLQLMLDRGPSQDWFESREIWVEALAAGLGFWVFIAHSLTAERPLFHLDLVRDRNFVSASIVQTFFAILMFSSIALLPLMMQTVLGYPVLLTGLVVAPRGVFVLAVLQVIGRLDSLVDRRVLVGFGLAMLTVSFWQMSQFNLDMTPRPLAIAAVVQGFGQGFVTVPLTTLAFATLRTNLRAEASAINNLIRMLGGSVGISIMQAITIVNGQRMHESLAAHLRLDDPLVRAALPQGASTQTLMQLNDEVTRQATMVAYVDDFKLMAFIALCAFPLVFLMRSNRNPAGSPVEALVE